MDTEVASVIRRLNDHGFDAFLVGGAVRDLLLGREPHDFDVATSAKPDEILALFPGSSYTNRFGTVLVGEVEVTTFRKDHSYGDHRRPDSVMYSDNILDDLARRDFTVNAIAMGLDGILVDPFGGKRDAGGKLLRAVGDADFRFSEDALRLLRCVRLASDLDFTVEFETFQAVMKHAKDIRFVSPERQGDELRKMLDFPAHKRSRALRLLDATGLLTEVLPGATSVPLRSDLELTTTRSILAGLLADVNPVVAGQLLNKLAFGSTMVRDVMHLIRSTELSFNPTDRVSVRRFMRQAGREYVSELLALTDDPNQDAIDREVDAPLTLSELAVDGHDMLAAGLEGILIGTTLAGLLAAVVDDPSLNTRDQLLKLI